MGGEKWLNKLVERLNSAFEKKITGDSLSPFSPFTKGAKWFIPPCG